MGYPKPDIVQLNGHDTAFWKNSQERESHDIGLLCYNCELQTSEYLYLAFNAERMVGAGSWPGRKGAFRKCLSAGKLISFCKVGRLMAFEV